jgi:hypothetical protein
MPENQAHSHYERAKARIVEEAAKQAQAKFEKDFAEGMRLVGEYPDLFAYVGAAVLAAPMSAEASNEAVRDLLESYRTHPDSAFHKLRFKTKENYASLLKRLENDIGDVLIMALDEARVREEYAKWAQGGPAMAHSLITTLRIAAAFGANILKSRACRELKLTLHDMRFPVVKSRSERLTEEQADDIRAMAHKLRRPSIALAQALQWAGLRQKMCIGEWLPTTEPGVSEVIDSGLKWLNGLRWNHIDQNMILRFTPPSQKPIEIDLRKERMVMEEFARQNLPRLNTSDPVLIHEKTRLPYQNYQFRRLWRQVADAAGVPKSIKNMDSRQDSPGRPHPNSKGKEAAL